MSSIPVGKFNPASMIAVAAQVLEVFVCASYVPVPLVLGETPTGGLGHDVATI